jgi:hypothetical protein
MAKKLTKADLGMLDRGIEMASAGGFYTANSREYRRCEKLREAGLLMFWNGRRSRFWSSQFFTITDKGRLARLGARRG